MATALPPPNVPDLQADNSIDLDLLGDKNLETLIDYPGIAEGDFFWPNWRGCGAQGEVVDYFDDLIEIGIGDLLPDGMPVSITNAQLKALDQGWVFYSYIPMDVTQPDNRGEESQRRFFYVGKRSAQVTLLPVLQFKESHDLGVDLSQVPANGATLVMLPYRAMAVGDKVTLSVARFFDDDIPYQPFTRTKTLTGAEVGQPLEWTLPKNELEIIVDGRIEISYSIVYATPTEATVSARQSLKIIKPTAPLLPRISIKGLTGGALDPEAFPDGITLVVALLYPGIEVGDDVLLYADSDTQQIRVLTVDPSTLDSRVLEFSLDYGWLSANNGKEARFTYQYARVGASGTSTPLSLQLRKPLHLPPPIVEDVILEDSEEGEYKKGYLLAERIIGGVRIKVPEEAVIGADDKVQMHWDGYGPTGVHVADPTVADAQRFYIPPAAVPANMGKRLEVSYRVTPQGEGSVRSEVFNLEIRDMIKGWPEIQITSPSAPGNKLSLAQVGAQGATLSLGSWTYMAAGQRVKIKAVGVLDAGGRDTIYLREGDDETVTDAEYSVGELLSTLPRAFLQRLKLNEQFDVAVETSFDQGHSYKVFSLISCQLIT